ncbi:hypothetical protein D3C76_1087540 [compost metagenome]
MNTNKFQAPMTLVAVNAVFDIDGETRRKMLHGLAYHGLVNDAVKLKQYAKGLCDKYINEQVQYEFEPGEWVDARITFEMVEFGAVVPDDVILPMGSCDNSKAAMVNMQMIVAPIYGEPLEDVEKYPDIVGVIL